MESNLKVFISWSGPVSHKVATIFRDWLPSVIQNIEPYVSSEDIDKGARWSTDIAGELHASTYGLVCLTKDNINAPWINFEAGALGKSIDKSRVSPFLFRLQRSEVDGPILQFQSTVFEKEDVLKLLKSINQACGQDALEDVRLERAFEVWWPELNMQLSDIQEPGNVEAASGVNDAESLANDKVVRVLEEVLELTRNNHKLLRDPTSLLPLEYLEHAVRRRVVRETEPLGVRGFEGVIEPEAIRDLIERYRDALKGFARMRPVLERQPEFEEVYQLMERLDSPIRYISSKMNMRIPREPFADKVPF